jgi:hypothetical protein
MGGKRGGELLVAERLDACDAPVGAAAWHVRCAPGKAAACNWPTSGTAVRQPDAQVLLPALHPIPFNHALPRGAMPSAHRLGSSKPVTFPPR